MLGWGLFSASVRTIVVYVSIVRGRSTSFQQCQLHAFISLILSLMPRSSLGLPLLTELLSPRGAPGVMWRAGGRAGFGMCGLGVGHDTSISVSRCWGIVPEVMAGWPAAFPHRVST